MTENTKNNSRRIKLRCLQLVEDKHRKKKFDDEVMGRRKLQKDFLFFYIFYNLTGVLVVIFLLFL